MLIVLVSRRGNGMGWCVLLRLDVVCHWLFIYSFCFSRTRAISQLQSSTTKAWFSFLVGRGSSNTKVFQSSSDIQQHLLLSRFRWGSALPRGGGVLPAKAAFIGGDPVPSSSSHCGLGQTRIGPFIGGHRWPSIIIITYQVKCTGGNWRARSSVLTGHWGNHSPLALIINHSPVSTGLLLMIIAFIC